MSPTKPELTERNLCETAVTIDWLKKVLCDSAGAKSEIKSWDAKRVGVGQGFLSFILKVELKWEPSNSKLPDKVILKVPTFETLSGHMDELIDPGEDRDKLEATMVNEFLPLGHKNECIFYEIFKDSCPIPIPNSYHTQTMDGGAVGVIVMEDLSSNSAMVNIADGLRLSQVMNIAASIGKFQAFALKNKSKWFKKFPPPPKTQFDEFPKMMEQISSALADIKKEYFDGKLEKILHLFDGDYTYATMLHSHEELGLPAVLVHGDMWTNNMLFHPDESAENGASDEILAFIDWQLAHPGNMCEDIGRILASSTPTHIRRDHLDDILRCYFQSLTTHLGEKPAFSLEDVKKAYWRVFPYCMSLFVCGVPMMINSPVIEGDRKEERQEQMLLRARDIIDDTIALHPPPTKYTE